MPKDISYESLFKKIPNDQLLKTLLDEVDNPEWLQGLTLCQMQTADSLQALIRDDLKQHTTYRVRQALITLGIQPIVNRKKLWTAIKLSNGNDIAFLWFLMELYYRHTCDNCDHLMYTRYTTNEQLIMSIIAHLDMIPTLRELNRILPEPPQKLKPERLPKKKKKKEIEQTKSLPYFEKQEPPVLYGKKLTATASNPVANICEYEDYLNPHFIPHNVDNRWYASYTLSPSKRVAKSIFEEIVNGIFAKGNADYIRKLKNQKVYCAHHKELIAKKRRKDKLDLFKRTISVKNLDVDEWIKKQGLQTFEKQIDSKRTMIKEDLKTTTTHNDDICVLKEGSEKKESEKKGSCIKMICVSKQATYDENFKKSDFGKNSENVYSQAQYKKRHLKFINNSFDSNRNMNINPTLDSEDAFVRHKRFWEELVRKEKELPPQNRKGHRHISSDEQITYDPFNKKLMYSMLRSALNIIKRDKRFVLAAMPDAHKMPVLKAWIKKRYGYFYSFKERKMSVSKTKLLFQTLSKIGIHNEIPQCNNLAKKDFVKYSCRDYLVKKSNYYRDKYFHNFKACLMDQSRMCWNVVRPNQCLRGSPKKTFFAYLPSREDDVKMFRPWQPYEHGKAYSEWRRRRRGSQTP